MSGYFIETPSGQRGPYSIERLQRLVEERKVPIEIAVVEESTGESVLLQELLEGASPSSRAPSRRSASPRSSGARPTRRATSARSFRGGSNSRRGPRKKKIKTALIVILAVVGVFCVGKCQRPR